MVRPREFVVGVKAPVHADPLPWWGRGRGRPAAKVKDARTRAAHPLSRSNAGDVRDTLCFLARTAKERIMTSLTLGTDDEPAWKICLKAAKWAGRIGVLFAFAFMAVALVFGSTGAPDSDWIAVTTDWGMKIAILFGVLCLVTAAFGFALRRRQNIRADRDKAHAGKQVV